MGSTNTTIIDLPIHETFALVADPTTYPEWLVGAQDVTEVSEAWPEVGSSFTHRIGFGPLRVPGSTTIRDISAPTNLTLGAGMGPLGEAHVEFVLEAVDADHTQVTVTETPIGGLARASWFIYRPIVFGLLLGRNAASLEMLAKLARRDPYAGAAVSSPAAGRTTPRVP